MLEADIVLLTMDTRKKPSYTTGLHILTFRHTLIKMCLPFSKPWISLLIRVLVLHDFSNFFVLLCMSSCRN